MNTEIEKEVMPPTLIGLRYKLMSKLAKKLISLRSNKSSLTEKEHEIYLDKAAKLLLCFQTVNEASRMLNFLFFLNPKLCHDLIDQL